MVLVIVLFMRTSKTNARLDHIERYLEQLTRGEAQQSAPQATPASQAPVASHTLLEQQAAPPVERTGGWRQTTPSEPNVLERFFGWCKEDWLMKLGGFLVILGAGWFVSYAVAQGWIGEMGRITLALTTGAAVLGLGWFRIRSFVTQGSVLQFVGAVIIVLAMFAARELYDFFTPLSALVVMFLTAATLGASSIVFKQRPLSYANVLLAGIAPLMIDSTLSITELFLYLLVFTIGALWVTAITGWRMLPLIALIVVGLYSIGEIESTWWASAELDIGLVFAYIFTALFFGISIMGMRVVHKTNIVDLLTALGTGLFLLVWILIAAAPASPYATLQGTEAQTGNDWRSLLLMVWTVVFAWGAFLAVRWGATLNYFYSYVAVGVVYLGTATMLELEGGVLTIALALEAAALLAIGYRVTGRTSSIVLLAIPSVVPLLLSLGSVMADEWHDSIIHVHALVLVIMSTIVASVAYAFGSEKAKRPKEDHETLENVEHTGYIISGLYDLTLIWLVTHALFMYEVGTFVALTVYTLIAAGFYFAGKVTGEWWQRMVAGVLFGGVIARLVFVEAWLMPQGMRIVTFFIIGGLAIAVAWIERSTIQIRKQDDDTPNTQ